eukprot:3013158-Pyramimonas_sp.AAC.2
MYVQGVHFRKTFTGEAQVRCTAQAYVSTSGDENVNKLSTAQRFCTLRAHACKDDGFRNLKRAHLFEYGMDRHRSVCLFLVIVL